MPGQLRQNIHKGCPLRQAGRHALQVSLISILIRLISFLQNNFGRDRHNINMLQRRILILHSLYCAGGVLYLALVIRESPQYSVRIAGHLFIFVNNNIRKLLIPLQAVTVIQVFGHNLHLLRGIWLLLTFHEKLQIHQKNQRRCCTRCRQNHLNPFSVLHQTAHLKFL